ncbi:MAG: hypothetical protein NT114_01305 [Patescibacteria group bacterium]|nr:hypothetical protein [Patescibacteria group bacterium]
MKKFLQIFSVLLLSCISVVAIGMAKPQTARAEVPTEWASRTGVQCRWQNTSSIRCSDDYGSNASATYSLDVVSSATSGHLVFQVDAKADERAAKTKQYGVLHFDNNTTYNDLTITTSKTDVSGGVNINDVTKDDIPRDLNVEDGGRPNVCSLSNLEVGCINGFTQPFDAKNKSAATEAQLAKVGTILKEGVASQAPDDCQVAVGALGFFLCPLQEIMQKVLVWIVDLFVAFLTTPALNSGSEGINRAIVGVTAIANGFYSIIFLIIIFANFIAIPGLDNYTVKKLLPKLITVIILTQFSFLICSVIIDIGNIAGQTIPSQVLSLYKGAPTDVVAAIAEMLNPYKAIVDELSKVGFSAADAGTIVAIYILAIFQIIAMVIIALISIFYLMFRWFAILLLTIFAPIAFAAWVLPNTEKLTKTWITAFMKLTLMYVLVMTVLASAVIAQDVLKSIDGPVAIIMSLFIPLIALALVPKCLKVSGSMITAAGKMAADTKAGKAASGAAKGAVKKSGQEGKLAELKGKGFGATGKAMGALTGGRAGIGMQAKGAQLKAAPDKARAEKIGSLSFEEQQKLAAQPGENNKNAKAAQTALGQKLSELSNKRNLNGKEYQQLASLTGTGGITGTGTPNADFNPNINKDYAGIIANPLYSGGNGGGAPVTPPQPAPGAGGGTQQAAGGAAPVTAPKPPPGGNTPPPYRGVNPKWQAAPGSHGTPPSPTPASSSPPVPPSGKIEDKAKNIAGGQFS